MKDNSDENVGLKDGKAKTVRANCLSFVKEYGVPVATTLTTAAGWGWGSTWASVAIVEAVQEIVSPAGERTAEILGVGIFGIVDGVGNLVFPLAVGAAAYYAQNYAQKVLETCEISNPLSNLCSRKTRYDRM